MSSFKEDIKRNNQLMSFMYLGTYRFGNWVYYKAKPQIIRKLLHYVYRVIDQIIVQIIGGGYLPGRCQIGGGLYLPHGVNGIVIHGSAKIGENARIAHQVTIGQNYTPDAVPEIGNNVVINPGAKIFGGIKIGNNVQIGANAVVTKDIPSNCIAVGVPAKVIRKLL